MFFFIFFSSEIAASCSTLAQNFMLPVSSESQSLPQIPPILRGSSVVLPYQHPQLQASNIQYNPNIHQPPITTFLHQFEQFANNKNVCINPLLLLLLLLCRKHKLKPSILSMILVFMRRTELRTLKKKRTYLCMSVRVYRSELCRMFSIIIKFDSV